MAMLTRGQQRGHAIITDPSLPGGSKEVDTISCGHCGLTIWEDEVEGGNGGVKMRGNVRDTSGRKALCGHCTCCDKDICLRPECRAKGCVPLEESIRRMERRAEYDKCAT
jgi:hypothetical protein